MRYLHQDHLGSVDTITDEAGRAVERLSYGAFGKRRIAAGANAWTDPALAIAAVNTPRGFTGHEHLDDFQLVHMNGRVYDPALGRFMSADPFVQFAESTQGLNRYSYVDNNPLSFTDPSGYYTNDDYWRYGYWGYGWGYGGGYDWGYGGAYGGPTDWTSGNTAIAPHCGPGVPACQVAGGEATSGSAAGRAYPGREGYARTVAHGRVGDSPEDAFSSSDRTRLGPRAIDDPTTGEARIAATAAVGGTAAGAYGRQYAASGRLYSHGEDHQRQREQAQWKRHSTIFYGQETEIVTGRELRIDLRTDTLMGFEGFYASAEPYALKADGNLAPYLISAEWSRLGGYRHVPKQYAFHGNIFLEKTFILDAGYNNIHGFKWFVKFSTSGDNSRYIVTTIRGHMGQAMRFLHRTLMSIVPFFFLSLCGPWGRDIHTKSVYS